MIYLHPTLASKPNLLKQLQNATQCQAVWVGNHLCQLVPAKSLGANA